MLKNSFLLGMKYSILVLIITFSIPKSLVAQNITIKGNNSVDETLLYAQTKQLGQFINRFNNQEDRFGNSLSPNDEKYRELEGRKIYIDVLFDKKNKSIGDTTRKQFVETVTNIVAPTFINFRDENWFAEVNAQFLYKGKLKDVILYLQVEQENLGYKWVITNVYFDEFNQLFFTRQIDEGIPQFLHPKSHELDFMNLRKIFNNNKNLEYYASKDFTPDHLTLFLYEIKNGLLKFKTVKNVKFHFFQVSGWYFEVSEFNRKSYNSGWLISNLFKVPEEEKRKFLKQILGNRI